MASPLDNPGNLAVRAAVEGAAVRPEPVVEFGRKKSPGYATETTIDDQQPLARSDEFAPLRLSDLPQIALPRDNTKPLVTANDRSAKKALEAYKSLRTRLLRSQANQGFRAIAVTSVGRAEGKTLTAFNLAYCCASVENLSVLLIDGDLRSGSLTKLIGRLPSAGLADVISGSAPCEQAIVRTDLPNLYVMGAGHSDVPPTELFTTERWGQMIRWSRNHFKMVLVDAQSIGAYADFELIADECDGVLLVVRARNTSKEALKNSIDQIEANKLLGIVWNGSDGENGDRVYS
jgi:capsular exopolysaccharide synthesis family protein